MDLKFDNIKTVSGITTIFKRFLAAEPVHNSTLNSDTQKFPEDMSTLMQLPLYWVEIVPYVPTGFSLLFLLLFSLRNHSNGAPDE